MSGPNARAQVGRDSLAELFTGSSNFIERVPMLRVAFTRTAEVCTEALESISEVPLQVALLGLDTGIAGDVLEPHNGKSAVGILHAADWSARLVICIERPAAFA